MSEVKSSNPLHGITLEKIILDLRAKLGWAAMGEKIKIRCFTNNPNVRSSLSFLRRTPWARKKVENLYLDFLSGNCYPQPKAKSEKELWPDMKL
jgi:uncharacterized protein (DUF2132 family)